MKVVNKQQKALTISSAVGIISAFLPWITVPIFGSVSGIKGDGIITLILFTLSLTLVVSSMYSWFIRENLKWFVIPINSLVFVIMVWKLASVQSMGFLGIGFWGTLLASFTGIFIFSRNFLNTPK